MHKQYFLQIVIYLLHFSNICNILWLGCTKMVNRVKLARIENDLTQEELARLVDVTRQTIGLLEKGKYNPSLNLCISICKVLNKTLDKLFWEV